MPTARDASPAWFGGMVASAALDPLDSNVEAGGASSCRGASGSSTAFVAAALAVRSGRPVLLPAAPRHDEPPPTSTLETRGSSAAEATIPPNQAGDASVEGGITGQRRRDQR